MARRSDVPRYSKRVKVSEKPKKSKALSKTVRLVLLKELKLNILGSVTGDTYTFSGAGSRLDVDRRDADIMLQKKGGKCCPTGSGPTPYFDTV